jgi:hypothetical protein
VSVGERPCADDVRLWAKLFLSTPRHLDVSSPHGSCSLRIEIKGSSWTCIISHSKAERLFWKHTDLPATTDFPTLANAVQGTSATSTAICAFDLAPVEMLLDHAPCIVSTAPVSKTTKQYPAPRTFLLGKVNWPIHYDEAQCC